MVYVFGTICIDGEEIENVKVSGEEHSDLKGFCHIERNYPDNIIVDEFKVADKYQSDEAGDTCIDWYTISDHRRYIDKFSPAREEIETGIIDSQDAVCQLSEDVEMRLADIEDALCELAG